MTEAYHDPIFSYLKQKNCQLFLAYLEKTDVLKGIKVDFPSWEFTYFFEAPKTLHILEYQTKGYAPRGLVTRLFLKCIQEICYAIPAIDQVIGVVVPNESEPTDQSIKLIELCRSLGVKFYPSDDGHSLIYANPYYDKSKKC